MPTGIFKPSYSGSHALVIGVNKYKHINPLAHAANDAVAVAKVLIDKFGFPAANVKLLTNAKATRSNIMKEYLALSDSHRVLPDDRALVFLPGTATPSAHAERLVSLCQLTATRLIFRRSFGGMN